MIDAMIDVILSSGELYMEKRDIWGISPKYFAPKYGEGRCMLHALWRVDDRPGQAIIPTRDYKQNRCMLAMTYFTSTTLAGRDYSGANPSGGTAVWYLKR